MGMTDRPQQIVLHFSWEQDGLHRQETYGPWTVTEDEAHLPDIAGFVKDWRRLTGVTPHVIMMAMVTDPAAWLREASRPIPPEPAAEGVTLEPREHNYPAGGILSVGSEPVTP